MSNTITRSEFQRLFAQSEVRLADFNDEDWAALASYGVARTDLEAIASSDGIIRGQAELDRVFNLLDRFDRNGSSHSFTMKQVASAGQPLTLTAPGSVTERLVAARRGHTSVTVSSFTENHLMGAFDLGKLSSEDWAALSGLGLSQKSIERLAGGNNLVQGRQSLHQLFAQLDRIDKDGSIYSVRTSQEAVQLGQGPTREQMTPAAQALAILERAYMAYEQPYRVYTDLLRARVLESSIAVETSEAPKVEIGPTEPILNSEGPRARPRLRTAPHAPASEVATKTQPPKSAVELAVPALRQPDRWACYTTCTLMLQKYDRKAPGQVMGAYFAHHMSRGERLSDGAVTGWKHDFDRGLAYIDHCLDNKRPVIVGLSHSGGNAYNLNTATDHFVIITGRGVDEQGRVFYSFNDPAASAGPAKSRFYVDQETSMLFRPPHDTNGLSARDYQVTQVATYNDMPFSDVVGHAPTPVSGH